jgi:hypothetical protein
MTIASFLEKLKQIPKSISFAETIAVIDKHYDFTPTAFKNGLLDNAAGENSGSCKLFAFAQLQKLSKKETLFCFGAYYSEGVLAEPDGTNHPNIRNFIKTGWNGIQLNGVALVLK